MEKGDLIDASTNWLTKKGASYLAKEGQIVYYCSYTGRKSDYRWHKLSLTEAARIITATQLAADLALPLKPEHIVAACQELDKVYEFGMSSRHKCAPEVFNYLEQADVDLAAQIMYMLAREFMSQSVLAFKINDMLEVFNDLNLRLEAGASPTETRDLYWCHFQEFEYEIRTEQYRVLIDGKKVPVIMQPGSKPRNIVDLTPEFKIKVIRKIFGALR